MEKTIELKLEEKKDYRFEEALKTLRTNLQFCGTNIKTILFTSAVPGEGKSQIVFSEAESLAALGKKVLIVDADIRKSVLLARYQVDKETGGLSEYLSGQKKLDDVVFKTNISGLDIIFSGPYSPNPSELLAEPLFKKALEEKRESYDYILIDTPPMGGLIDGAIIARECDGAVLVIESGAVSRRVLKRVKAQLERSGCRILGAVLNKVKSEANGYYGKQYDKYYGNKQ